MTSTLYEYILIQHLTLFNVDMASRLPGQNRYVSKKHIMLLLKVVDGGNNCKC